MFETRKVWQEVIEKIFRSLPKPAGSFQSDIRFYQFSCQYGTWVWRLKELEVGCER
jgi:hypothetical protein